MQTNNTIVVITDGYPYDRADSFLHDEFIEINKHFSHVIYVPQNETGKLVLELNDHIQLNTAVIEAEQHFSKNILFKNLGSVLSIFFTEIFRSKKTVYIFSNLRTFFRSINRSLHVAEALKPILQNLPKDSTIYSTWMNSAALALAILKRKKIITKFSFRVNGFDIFDDRHDGNYMPFRIFNFKHTSRIIALSSVAQTYLVKKNIYPEKITLNYSGIYSNPLNPFKINQEFTIISCSFLFELKRVDLIVEALKFISFNVNWIHIGDGIERKAIEEKIKQLPKNIRVNLMGQLRQEEIREVYCQTPINLFIHVSRTEGLGMAIIEAQSYGIPQLCCAAGGVVDVVSDKTGILIPVNSTPEQIATQIKKFRDSEKNSTEFRLQVQNEFAKKFEIQENFKSLMKIL